VLILRGEADGDRVAQIAERIGTSQVHVSRLLASTMVQLRRVTEAEAEADAAADAAVRGAVVDV